MAGDKKKVALNRVRWRRIVRDPMLHEGVTENLLYTCDITNNLDEEIKTVQFADDIAAYIVNRDRNRNKIKLEQAVTRKFSTIGLDLEPKKIVLIEFSKYGTWDKTLNIRIKDTIVTSEREARFLGIWLDRGLNYDKQVQKIRGRVKLTH